MAVSSLVLGNLGGPTGNRMAKVSQEDQPSLVAAESRIARVPLEDRVGVVPYVQPMIGVAKATASSEATLQALHLPAPVGPGASGEPGGRRPGAGPGALVAAEQRQAALAAFCSRLARCAKPFNHLYDLPLVDPGALPISPPGLYLPLG